MLEFGANGTYLSRKVVSDALRRWYFLSPRRRPGPNFRRIAAQTTFDPGLVCLKIELS